MAEMTETDVRDIRNHILMFGGAAVVHKMGRKWWVRFRTFGPPTPFRTKAEATEWASRWPAALRHSQAA